MKYVSIDIETTHVEPELGQILEFAAVFEDSSSPMCLNDMQTFEAIVYHEQIYGNAYAIQMNNRLMEIIAGVEDVPEGVYLVDSMEQLYASFDAWLFEIDPSIEQVVIAGKNVAGFDIPWIKQHCPDMAKTFHRRTLDPGSLYTFPDDEAPPNLTTCLQRAGYDGPTDLHCALADAWDVIRCIRSAWNHDVS